MAESLENLDEILPDWVNEDIGKTLAETVDKFQNEEKEKNKNKNTFLWRKRLEQNCRAISVERHQPKHKMGGDRLCVFFFLNKKIGF